MPNVSAGWYTAELADDGVAVFLIGMRFNRWWRPSARRQETVPEMAECK